MPRRPQARRMRGAMTPATALPSKSLTTVLGSHSASTATRRTVAVSMGIGRSFSLSDTTASCRHAPHLSKPTSGWICYRLALLGLRLRRRAPSKVSRKLAADVAAVRPYGASKWNTTSDHVVLRSPLRLTPPRPRRIPGQLAMAFDHASSGMFHSSASRLQAHSRTRSGPKFSMAAAFFRAASSASLTTRMRCRAGPRLPASSSARICSTIRTALACAG